MLPYNIATFIRNVQQGVSTSREVVGEDLPASDVLRGVAEKVDIIEDGSLGAANLPGVETILADVEEPTVVRVNITSVVQLLAVGVKLGVVGAREPVSEDLCRANKRPCYTRASSILR